MSNPIATQTPGFLCYAFPDVCKTQVGPAQVPLPYPNSGDLANAINVSENVFVQGKPVIRLDSKIPVSTGDEAGALGGVNNDGIVAGEITFTRGSSSVFVNGKPVVRMFDSTSHNQGNAIGAVQSGDSTVTVAD